MITLPFFILVGLLMLPIQAILLLGLLYIVTQLRTIAQQMHSTLNTKP